MQFLESMNIKIIVAILFLKVKVYCGGAQEVAVTYRVDEFNIELAVCVPGSYPLQVPSIKEGRRARVDINQWKKWLLQLSVFVANQVFSLLYKKYL